MTHSFNGFLISLNILLIAVSIKAAGGWLLLKATEPNESDHHCEECSQWDSYSRH